MKLLNNLFPSPRAKGLKLLKSVFSNNLQAAESLIQAGADLNLKDNYYNGETALFIATRSCYKDLVRLLLEKGADVNVKNSSGETPLSVALVNGKINNLFLPIAELLIENGADLKARDYLSLAIVNDHSDIVQLLINKGVDVNSTNSPGESILFSPLKTGNLRIARILIENGADINLKNKEGESPLMIAASKGNIGAAKTQPYIEIAQLLIEKGVALDAQNNYGITALSRALDCGHLDIARLLIENGADINAEGILMSALAYQEIVRLLIEKGIDLSTELAGKALNVAIQNNQLDTALLLIEKGVNVNVVHGYYDMEYDRALTYYALHLALQKNLPDIVIRLIEQGADVNAKDYEGKSPLHLLAYKWGYEDESLKIAQLLLDKGADIQAKNGGLSPIEIAEDSGYKELVQLLRNAEEKN